MNSGHTHTREASENDNIVQTVAAIKNSWVVCRSKSHAGRTYYFNTVTGEAAWKLSDAEIETAYKRTKILQSQPGSMLDSCPEPKDPPVENIPIHQNNIISHQCNLLPRNQFPKQKNQSCLNPHYVKYIPVNPANTQQFNTQLVQPFNPNIWTIPANHQIVIAPATLPPQAPAAPTSLNVAYNNLQQQVSVQDTFTPLSKRFNTYHNAGITNLRFGQNKFVPRKHFMNVNQEHNATYRSNKFNSPSTSWDLRQKLSSRKTNNDWKKPEYQDNGSYRMQTTSTNNNPGGFGLKIHITRPSAEELCPTDIDDHWLKEHAHVEGTQLKLNVRSLKDIVMVDPNVGCWYIVVDSATLLDHFNFINVVVSSDWQCRLMISDDTLAELQSIRRSNESQLMNRAHLVLWLLSQQFTTGGAVIGKDSSCDSWPNRIINFTIKLTEQIHNVVLVSNDNEGTKYNSIKVYTILEIKEIIANTLPIVAKPKMQFMAETCGIKISVPNDTRHIDCDEETINNSVFNEVQHKNVNYEENGRKTPVKNMGVQTEIETESNKTKIETESNKNILSEISRKDTISITSTDEKSKKLNLQANNFQDTDNNKPKRREIRLKRNISQCANSTDDNVEKKQFKWRKRKKDAVETSIESKQSTLTDVTDGVIDKDKQSTNFSDSENLLCDKLTNNETYDSHSETTNDSRIMQKDVSEKVIIEETSTSGIISNTASNVDSGSLYSVNQTFPSNFNYDTYDHENLNQCVMFEIENSLMEDRLKMRSDEWLSRFVQIMEEILSLVLRLDPPFNHPSLPPPWNLHEATECVKRKFHTDSDVLNAANKLTDVLFRNSDSRGKINIPLKPSVFAEMYSYGVYLVDALLAVVTNCDDLQTAENSLAKLWSEIQESNSFGFNNDSFNDEDNEPSARTTACSSANSLVESSTTSNTKKSKNKQVNNNSDGKDSKKNNEKGYNLRSSQGSKKSDENIPEPQNVSFIRNVDVESTFFSSLKLKRNHDNENYVPLEEHIESDYETNSKDKSDNQDSPQPKIIRNFNTYLEYEERLKTKKGTEGIDFTDDQLDGYYFDNEYCDYDYYGNDDFEHDIPQSEIDQENGEECETDENGNHDFKWIIMGIKKVLQQAFTQVRTFYTNTREDLKNLESLSPMRRLQIQKQSEFAKLHLDNTLKSLNSIILREDDECGANIQTILHDFGVIFDTSQVDEYRKIIAKGKEQACFLLDSINILMEAVKLP